jgi:glyoxylase-like metal-dependent hydrolase (beta-lactamase superfamily II)
MISALIEHPDDGLFLFETGAGKDYPEVWGPQLADLFAREDNPQNEELELDAAIRKTGHDIKDIKGVIIGHLHLDHAGGLEYFRNTDVPIYAHELELKHAYYSVATKTDLGRLSERVFTLCCARIELTKCPKRRIPPYLLDF